MPGMMDTVLNLGLNDKSVEGLAARTRNERFAWDCYRRFITLFGDVVLSIDRHTLDALLETAKTRAGAKTDADLPPAALRELVAELKKVVQDKTGRPFPQDPHEQLRLAINAVFESWWAKKAVDYRRIHRLPDDWGTAVTVHGDGLRQSRADLGHRGVLLARSLERRAALLRRVPRQRPG